MLSYRHAFHAGNHGDVLKHLVLTQLLRYLGQKPKPFWYIDTHAGAGLYPLTRGYATKTTEAADGIARLLRSDTLPEALTDYCQIIKKFNKNEKLETYPGSPGIAASLVREQDRLHLFELHPSDFETLQSNMEHQKARNHCRQEDGLKGLKSLLPPQPRRAVILIDPPYEQKQEYRAVAETVKDALKRFSTGVYAIWYPLLQRREVDELIRNLDALPCDKRLNVTLSVETPRPDGFGMHGSGMYIFNPPWMLRDVLSENLPVLTDLLAQDPGAEFSISP